MSKITVKFEFQDLLGKLVNKDNFSFARFGDGELNCAFGKKGKNCDGHEYFTDMSEYLLKILNSKPEYYVGLQNLGYNIWMDRINKLTDIDFCDADILHKASIKNKFESVFEILKKRDVILIAPEYFKNFNKIKPTHHIIIPEKNCWLSKTEIFKNLETKILENCVVLYSASMMSNVFIDLLYKKYKNTITQIDCGSVFDPYIGINKRKYHQSIIDRLKNENNSI